MVSLPTEESSVDKTEEKTSVCLVSVMRIICLKNLYGSQTDGSRAFTYDMATVANWSSIEINTDIICACITTLTPLWCKLFGTQSTALRLDDGLSAGDIPRTIGSLRLRSITQHRDIEPSEIYGSPPTDTTYQSDNKSQLDGSAVVPIDILDAGSGRSSPKRVPVVPTVILENISKEQTQETDYGDERPSSRARPIWGSTSDEEWRQDSSLRCL